jgi:hypothetical protein
VNEVHVVPHMWLQKTTSGKIARRPNLDRFRELEAARAAAAPPIPDAGMAGVLEAVAWGALAAVAILVIVALQASLSWGLYSGF